MKKYILFSLSWLLCLAALAGCSCQHEWTEADCTEPKTCTKCAAVEGDALGHSWQEADCETPKTCSRCGLTEGTAPGHSWQEATCTAPKTCSVCSAAEGEPLEHHWTGEATLYTAPVCTVCGAEGEPLPGYLGQNGLAPNVRPETETEYSTCTYVRPDLDTTGSFFASDVLVFEGDANHQAKKGYEWRRTDIIIHFSDNNSELYGANVVCARADYYQDIQLKQAKKQERFAVTYHGKEYRCNAFYDNMEFFYTETGSAFRMTCFVQVPVGYDGVVLAFPHGSNTVDGMHLHELEDENMLLFRLA